MNAPIKRAGVILGLIVAVLAAFFTVSIVAPQASMSPQNVMIAQ